MKCMYKKTPAPLCVLRKGGVLYCPPSAIKLCFRGDRTGLTSGRCPLTIHLTWLVFGPSRYEHCILAQAVPRPLDRPAVRKWSGRCTECRACDPPCTSSGGHARQPALLVALRRRAGDRGFCYWFTGPSETLHPDRSSHC